MCNLTIGDLAQELGGKLRLGSLPPLDGAVTALGPIVTDSRCVQPGDVFWALVGPRRDGADFADEALARGAAGVVVAGRDIEPWAGRWALEVEDTQWALWQLAGAARRRMSGSVVAVTGSVGAAATRQMIDTVLGSRLQGSAAPPAHRDHFGLPLAMLHWDEEDDYAVIELGASHRGEIDSAASLCQPRIGVIPCIAEPQPNSFGAQRDIAESKSELLAALPRDGVAVLGGDDFWLRQLADTCRADKLWFGRSPECDLVARDVLWDGGQLRFRLDGRDYRVATWGRDDLRAALAAIGVGRVMGLVEDDIVAALAGFEPPPLRCRVHQVRGITVLDGTGDARAAATAEALQLLADVEVSGRRIVVTAAATESTAQGTRRQQQLGAETVALGRADLLVACGNTARDLVTAARDAGLSLDGAIACNQPLDAIPLLAARVVPGDVVLVCGPRTAGMERIVEALTRIDGDEADRARAA